MPVTDKNGEQINVGDTVSTKSRGGKRAGVVTDIVETQKDAEKKSVKHPPKVLFVDQHGR
jgi:transcription elongation factor